VIGIIAIRYLFGYLISMGNWQALGGIGDSKIATVVIGAFVAVLLGVGCGSEQTTSPPEQTSSPEQTPSKPEQTSSPPVVVAAGDIADCRTEGDEATARLVDGIQGTVLTLGDNAYPDGSAEDFEECYDPTWGRFKDRTKPSPGNHDYHAQTAEGYFEYFGKAAGDPMRATTPTTLGTGTSSPSTATAARGLAARLPRRR
jgi:hypothetical protein